MSSVTRGDKIRITKPEWQRPDAEYVVHLVWEKCVTVKIGHHSIIFYHDEYEVVDTKV